MTKAQRVSVPLLTLALVLTAASTHGVPAPDGPAQAAPPDSTRRIVDTTVVVDRFVPVSTSYVRGGDSDISLGSRMNTILNPGLGWLVTNSIMIERKSYRTREAEDLSQNIGGRASRAEEGVYALDFSFGDSYSRKKTLGLARFGKEIIYNNTSADFNYSYSKPLLGAKQSVLAVNASGRRGTNDFKYDRALSGGLTASLSYAFGNLASLSGGFGTSRSRESSDVGSIKFAAMPSSGDTMRAGFIFGKPEAKVVSVDYSRIYGVERTVMLPLGNALEILDDPSKANREVTKQRGEDLLVTSSVAPFPFIGVDIQFHRTVQSQSYAVDRRLSGASEDNDLTANARYQYASSGLFTAQVSTSQANNDYGPLSLSSFKERDHTISMSLSQKISDSLSVSLGGTSYLKQRFFSKRDVNPRDVDYLYYHGEASIRATPVRRITTDVTLAADRYETINIDQTYSGDNRNDYQYRVGPTITLRPSNWFSISQDYMVKIEYTDFVYTEDKNYLNRTTTLNTAAGFTIFKPLSLSIKHSYLMKDTGSYLMREGERRYNRSNQNVEHGLFFDMAYLVQRDFTIRAQADFRTQRNNVLGAVGGAKGVVSSSLFESGGMRIGFVRNKRIPGGGSINLDVSYVRRYGPYLTQERKEYWDVNSNITLKF
jgi:hypothetical protein